MSSGEATMFTSGQNKGWSSPYSEVLDTDHSQKARRELVRSLLPKFIENVAKLTNFGGRRL